MSDPVGRDVEEGVTAAELSGQVLNLKNLEDFNGIYKTVERAESVGSGGTRATIKNQNGMVVNVIVTTGGGINSHLGLTASRYNSRNKIIGAHLEGLRLAGHYRSISHVDLYSGARRIAWRWTARIQA